METRSFYRWHHLLDSLSFKVHEDKKEKIERNRVSGGQSAKSKWSMDSYDVLLITMTGNNYA